jgi:hypothetical protein
MSIITALLTTICTAGLVIADEAWAIVDVKLALRELGKDPYPGTEMPSMSSIPRTTWTKFFWTVERGRDD